MYTPVPTKVCDFRPYTAETVVRTIVRPVSIRIRSLLSNSTFGGSKLISRSYLVMTLGVASCGDPTIAPQPVTPVEPPVTPTTPTTPTVPTTPTSNVLLDVGALRDIGLQRLIPGDQIPVTLDANSDVSVVESEVALRDTSVVSLDSAGVLHAHSVGKAWIVWPWGDSNDSAQVTVTTGQLQQPYTAPAGPLKTVDVRYPTRRTRGAGAAKSWRVGPGEDLQAAINAALPGDEIVLAQGATFTGNYILPTKSTSTTAEWIVVRAEVLTSGTGTRADPLLMVGGPKIITPNQDPAIRTANGARRWRLVGFEVAHAPQALFNYGIVVLGRGDETSLAQLPAEIVLDRMYVHGSTTDGTSRCVAFNGRSLAVVDSWLSECHAKGSDAQGIGGWGGTGPFLIENNRIEASGQAIMFGGADPSIADLSPSDIIIRRNYLFKPLSWARGKWSVKATFELKHAKRVIFESNVLENHWIDAQVGFPILFQTVSQYNKAPWSVVQDVLVQNNLIINATSGANLLSRINQVPVSVTSRVAFLNNVFRDVGKDPITGEEGRVLQLLGDVQDITFMNNTSTLSTGRAMQAVMFDGPPGQRTTIADNVFPASSYGIFGSNKGTGNVALQYYAPGGVITGNILPGQGANSYPTGNYFPGSIPAAAAQALGLTGTCNAVRDWVALLLGKSSGADCSALDTALRNVTGVQPN